MSFETASVLRQQLLRITSEQGRSLITIIRQYGFTQSGFARAIDYMANPWPIALNDIRPDQLPELLYRTGEIWEDGRFQPLDPLLRRPSVIHSQQSNNT
jgi:hypothetical protein